MTSVMSRLRDTWITSESCMEAFYGFILFVFFTFENQCPSASIIWEILQCLSPVKLQQ